MKLAQPSGIRIFFKKKNIKSEIILQTKHGHFYFFQFDKKKKKISSGLEAVSGNGFVGVSLYGIRIADWVSVSIGG